MATQDASDGGKRKRFIPLENNPEVMTSLVRELGMNDSVGFHEVYSLDAEMLQFVPRPAYALLLVFPDNETNVKFRTAEDAKSIKYDGSGPQEEVIWYKQTIGNACGLIGLLHAASNGPVVDNLKSESPLRKLISQAIPLKPQARADLLYESDALEAAHATAAVQGETSAPPAEDKIETHYVCFVKTKEGNLWELDGMRSGPLNRGKLDPEDDVLSEKALNLGVRAFLKREEAAGGGDLRFSLIALSSAMD